MGWVSKDDHETRTWVQNNAFSCTFPCLHHDIDMGPGICLQRKGVQPGPAAEAACPGRRFADSPAGSRKHAVSTTSGPSPAAPEMLRAMERPPSLPTQGWRSR